MASNNATLHPHGGRTVLINMYTPLKHNDVGVVLGKRSRSARAAQRPPRAGPGRPQRTGARPGGRARAGTSGPSSIFCGTARSARTRSAPHGSAPARRCPLAARPGAAACPAPYDSSAATFCGTFRRMSVDPLTMRFTSHARAPCAAVVSACLSVWPGKYRRARKQRRHADCAASHVAGPASAGSCMHMQAHPTMSVRSPSAGTCKFAGTCKGAELQAPQPMRSALLPAPPPATAAMHRGGATGGWSACPVHHHRGSCTAGCHIVKTKLHSHTANALAQHANRA